MGLMVADRGVDGAMRVLMVGLVGTDEGLVGAGWGS